MKEKGHSGLEFGGISDGFQWQTAWTPSEYTVLVGGLEALQAGRELTLAEQAEMLALIQDGLDTRSGQAVVISELLHPGALSILDQVLDSPQLDDLSPADREALTEIAAEPDQTVRQDLLLQLVQAHHDPIRKPVAPLPEPRVAALPSALVLRTASEQREEDVRVERFLSSLREGNRDEFAELLATTPDVAGILAAAVERSGADYSLLAELLAYPDYVETALELFYQEGNAALPALESLYNDPLRGPAARELVRAIYEGDSPDAVSVITSQLESLAKDGDASMLARFMDWDAVNGSLPAAAADVTGDIDRLLVELLGDPARAPAAMQALHARGSRAMPALMQVRGSSSDASVIERASTVIEWNYQGRPAAGTEADGAASLSFAEIHQHLRLGGQPMNTLRRVLNLGDAAGPVLVQLLLQP